MSFLSVLEEIGKDFEKGLKWAVAYAVPVEKLVALLFPAAAPAVAGGGRCDHADPERGAAGGAEVRRQRRAERHRRAEAGRGDAAGWPAVTSLLQQAGIPASSDYVQSLISAVVAMLNVQAHAGDGG